MSVSAAFIKAIEPQKREQAAETRKRVSEQEKSVRFLPREHGATAMLFTPMVCAASPCPNLELDRDGRVYGCVCRVGGERSDGDSGAAEIGVETPACRNAGCGACWFAGWMLLLALSGVVLLMTWPLKATIALGAWSGRVFNFGSDGERKESAAVDAVSDCERGCTYFKFAGHVAFGNRNNSDVVLVAVVVFWHCRRRREF